MDNKKLMYKDYKNLNSSNFENFYDLNSLLKEKKNVIKNINYLKGKSIEEIDYQEGEEPEEE